MAQGGAPAGAPDDDIVMSSRNDDDRDFVTRHNQAYATSFFQPSTSAVVHNYFDNMQDPVAITEDQHAEPASSPIKPARVKSDNSNTSTVSTNPRGATAVARKCSIFDELLEFFSQKVQVSYLLIFVVFLGAALLILTVGLAAGLGPKRSFQKQIVHDDGDDKNDKPHKRSVVYEPSKPWTNFRLPSSLVPLHYLIDMRPQFYNDEDAYFTGQVTIDAKVKQPTKYVIVHAKALSINKVAVYYNDLATDLNVKQNFTFPHYDYFVIELTTMMKEDKVIKIELHFKGSLSNTFEGFYKAPFKPPPSAIDGSSTQKLYAVMTQFEPLAARRAFPCFDEPNLKAYFTIIMRHRPSVIALSNMPAVSRQTDYSDQGMTVVTSFQRTNVPMSTYLVAFVVGPYQTKPPCRQTTFNLPICIYAPDYLASQTQFALATAVRGMEWLQEFFGVSYPLPKLDLIVYPEFRSMAMENWGLISFREEALLVGTESTEEDKDAVTSVVIHELAHQWFGNLVTMDWWDDLWLNEGFASYMEYPGAWSMNRLLNGDDYNDFLRGITRDGYNSTRQIRVVDIQTGDDISAAFDGTTYLKGSSIIRMLVGAIGMDKFRAGIQAYMQKFQYRNARTSDLWESLSRNSSIDVAAAMSTWVEQKGYPLVTVSYSGSSQLILQQERFTLPLFTLEPFNSSTTDEALTARWYIPIVFQEIGWANTRTEWFPANGLPFVIHMEHQTGRLDELKINADQSAFIRVNYPEESWKKMGNNLLAKLNTFGPIDRAGLVDDVLELAKADRLDYGIAFSFLRFLSRETHPIVWEAFADQATFLRYGLADSPHYGTFEKFILALVRSAREQTLTSQMEMGAKAKTLALLASISLVYRQPQEIDCYSEYYRQQTWKNPENIELRRSIFVAYVLSNDTEETIGELLNLADQSTIKQVKKSVFFALSRTRHSWIVVRELEKLFSGDLRPPDFLTFAGYAGNSPQSRLFMWNWARANYNRLLPQFGGKTRNFMRWLIEIASFFNSPEQYRDVVGFVKSIGDFGAGERPKNQVLEKIQANTYWRMKVRKNAEKALDDNQTRTGRNLAAFIESLAKTPIRC